MKEIIINLLSATLGIAIILLGVYFTFDFVEYFSSDSVILNATFIAVGTTLSVFIGGAFVAKGIK